MGSAVKLRIIRAVDWIDDKILRHRIYWLCEKICMSSWWGLEAESVKLSNGYGGPTKT